MKSANHVLCQNTESPLILLCQSQPIVRNLLLATLFGALTALASQVHIRLPFTPVPLTGQVLLVLLAGGMLGPKWGAISQVQYIAIGLMGLPVFAQGMAGPAVFAGPTGGYLIGFVCAAWLVGSIMRGRTGIFISICASFAGLAAIYLPGWLWLAVWLQNIHPANDTLVQAFKLGILPFCAVDVVKSFLAAKTLHLVGRNCHTSC